MSYEDNKDFTEHDPWDHSTYRTGSTKPPKSHGGLIAVLLGVIILLSGVVTVLGVMNIRLFRQVNNAQDENTLPFVFSSIPGETDSLLENIPPAQIDEAAPSEDTTLDVHPSPTSAENTTQEGGLSLQDIYEKAIPSVVSISCEYRGGSSSGTGVILTEDGYIVTNCHVVEDAQAIEVILTDGRTVDAELIGMDAVSDLAVLHITAEDLVPAEMGNSASLRVGDTVVAIGDPLGIALRGTMTDGIVSAINRDIDVDGRTMNLIQTNAALNSGNSGGPLLNCYGQVIGINTMKMSDSMSSAGVEGLGFAIPSVTVTEVVNQLIAQGYVSGRPDIGITGESISSFYQFYYRMPQGLYITEVAEGSSADEVGIEAGDILISLDGVSITSSDALKSALYSYAAGDTVQAVIYRSGKQYTVTLTLGEANS